LGAKESRRPGREAAMFRFVLYALVFTGFAHAAEPSPLDKALAIQRAMAEAKAHLAAGQPSDATNALESVISNINGDADFLSLLREAYGEELKRQKLARSPDAKRIAVLEGKLAILNKSAPAEKSETQTHSKSEEAKPTEPLKKATELFNAANRRPENFAEAAKLFRQAQNEKSNFSTEQFAAWAYCRIKLAADAWNRSNRDAAATAAAVAEIEDALALAPDHADLQTAGRKLIQDVGGRPSVAKPKSPALSESRWASLESDNFRIRFPQDAAEAARELLTKSESARKDIFARWTSPSASTWQPKCELVLHPNAAEFAAATRQVPAGTGHAFIKLDAKGVVERRIDLRADDSTAAEDALPRELTHIVLADLFPDREPPRWAAIGMAVLATNTESERCQRTLERCHRAGELFAVSAFLDLKQPPKPDAVTAYYVQSASLVHHLVKRKDAKTFRIFLMDAARYGVEKALDRQYGYPSIKAFDDDWRRATLSTARGQKP
jgi:hypothetical protein